MMSRTAWLTTALVVLALFVGSVLDTRLPKPDPADADPFLRPGLVGQAVELRNGVVTATDVRVGTEIRSIGAITATTGRWLVVDYVFEARGEAQFKAPATLRLRAADGRQFGETPGTTAACGPAQPGIPLRCSVPFEVPVDAIAGAHLLVPAENGVDVMDDVADIDLGLTPDRAAELGASEGRVELAAPAPVER